jgi:tripartite-type tricarboxylate transporter receptor subunit TctC
VPGFDVNPWFGLFIRAGTAAPPIPKQRSGANMRNGLTVMATTVLVALAGAASAQEFPTKPIRLIDGFAPGGGTDVIARLMSPRLGELLGQPVVVENRPGATGTIGAATVVRAPPDGYTLLVGLSSTIAVSPSLLAKLPYDTLRDLVAVAQIVTFPNVLVVHPSVPTRSVKDLLALARARPDTLNFASGGLGTSNHLAGELLKSMAKVRIAHVPYKGGGPAVIAILGGEVDLLFATMPSATGFVRSGRLRPLAVTGPKRSAALPEVPTMIESGLPGFEVVSWMGMLAPAATPPDVIVKLNTAVNAVMGHADVRARIAEQASDVATGTPEQFAAIIRRDTDRWAKVVREAGIKSE